MLNEKGQLTGEEVPGFFGWRWKSVGMELNNPSLQTDLNKMLLFQG